MCNLLSLQTVVLSLVLHHDCLCLPLNPWDVSNYNVILGDAESHLCVYPAHLDEKLRPKVWAVFDKAYTKHVLAH